MDFIEALVASGRIAEVALGFLVLEAAGLLVFAKLRSRTHLFTNVMWNLAAGAFLLLALRAALIGADWIWIAVFLIAGLFANLLDTIRRLQRNPESGDRTLG